MTFSAKVSCDGFSCIREKELKSECPSSVETEVYELEDHGWVIGDDGFDYCPKCAEEIKAEREEE